MPSSTVLKLLTHATPSLLTMPTLKARPSKNPLKVFGFMDFGLKVPPGTNPSVISKTPRVKICSLPSPTSRSTLNAPQLNRRDLVHPRSPPLTTRTCTDAPSTGTPCVKIGTLSTSSISSLSPQVITRAKREKALSEIRTPWSTSGALEVLLSSARRSECYTPLLC